MLPASSPSLPPSTLPSRNLGSTTARCSLAKQPTAQFKSHPCPSIFPTNLPRAIEACADQISSNFYSPPNALSAQISDKTLLLPPLSGSLLIDETYSYNLALINLPEQWPLNISVLSQFLILQLFLSSCESLTRQILPNNCWPNIPSPYNSSRRCFTKPNFALQQRNCAAEHGSSPRLAETQQLCFSTLSPLSAPTTATTGCSRCSQTKPNHQIF